jgi:hypothetical protein
LERKIKESRKAHVFVIVNESIFFSSKILIDRSEVFESIIEQCPKP